MSVSGAPRPIEAVPDQALVLLLLTRANQVVYGSARLGAVANMVLGAMVIVGNEAAHHAWWAWSWLAALALVYAVRLRFSARFGSQPLAQQGVDALVWRRRVIVSATMAGVLWGLGLGAFWVVATLPERMMLVLVIAGLLPGVSSSLAPIPLAVVGFALPVWVAMSLSVARSATRPSEMVAALVPMLLLPLLLRSVRTLHLEFERGTTMRFEQDRLLKQLEQARDAALAAAGARSEFLSVMSHELRTPLNGVVGLTSLLLDDAESPAQRELAQGARDSAQMLLQLIDGVLDLSKIDAGHLELELADFSLEQELGKLRSLFELRAKEKGLILAVEVAAGVPARCHGDWFRLRQVLVNLLGNALKFTSQGSVRCEVRVGAEPGRVRFEVRDSGIGLTQAQRGRIFQPFVQADASTTRRFGGSGLGLVISKRLVALMGAELEVDSIEGQGSVFHFEIPLPEGKGDEVRAPPPAAPVGHGEWVLVCDDNEINLTVAFRLLERGGYRVLRCRNGAEALTVLEANPVDVVLMDLQMPVMDGFEALRRARGPVFRCLSPGVPFVALTASASVVEREACQAAGFDAFLTKPIEPGELLRTISQVCRPRP